MGNCIYCGESAGFFKDKHSECEVREQRNAAARKAEQVTLAKEQADASRKRHQERNQGRDKLRLDVIQGLKNGPGYEEIERGIQQAETNHLVPNWERNAFLARCWEDVVEKFLDDGLIDQTEEDRLGSFKNHFELSPAELDERGNLTKVVKSSILREIVNGVVPNRVEFNGSLPIAIQKNETIIWAFRDADYLQDVTRKEYVGRSHGVSIRIMQGVYYRTSQFKGHPVEHTQREKIDTGWVAITNKNFYFAGATKAIRLPYTKIVSLQQFDDGIGIIKDGANAKLQIFTTGDGWFTYNLIANLSQM